MKRWHIAIAMGIALLMVVVTLKHQLDTTTGVLKPFADNGKWGYKDSNGKVIIKPKFQYADKFYDGLAVVVQKNKYGFINKNGKITIKPKYSNARRFSDGLAEVGMSGKPVVGYINRKGKIVIKPVFRFIVMDDFTGMSKKHIKEYLDFGLFKNGKARVCVGTKFYIINKKGIVLREVKGVY